MPGDDGSSLALAMLEAVGDPAMLLDAAGVVVAANSDARRSWPGLARGRHLSMSLRSPDVLSAVEAVRRGEARALCEYAERVPVERFFRLTVSALDSGEEAAPERPAVMLVFRDLTEERRLEMMRADFVSNASHELRTPLASLLGFIETLQGPARGDEKARERFLDIMREQARRMARLIDDLLSLSRIEMSEHRRPETPIDLADLARQTVETMRKAAEDRGVAVAFSAPDGPLVVPGERDDLIRVVENLVENAVKYGGDGGRVEVTARRIATTTGPAAELAVRDFGPGIAPEHLPRLTERFYRVDTAASRAKGGTGLGLAIVKHIVIRHRGRLAMESKPGEGATFRAIFPLDPA
ncbi:ATP-binding protein [Alsobacter sp. SYSU M60028]|uniref:histidine kinase n=1 Tax=Alsobacter ponti TaxID=2962936 RepID=A0ABT1LEW5_9HYPH|nr:ATP-binding protein [Alsobacter ponti]MCP8940030.1 ATP-binding protein [Alsobacter ponti]